MKIQHNILSNPAIQKLFGCIPNSTSSMRFIGGCVRDILMDRKIGDIDLATTLNPDELMVCLNRAHIKAVPTGLAFGTITAIIDQTAFQITTLRQDVQTDGRHAVVEFTDDWQLDALRRDFTINALSLDINGQLYDYTNSLNDIRDRKLTFIGDPVLRIQEDYLRILRYFRFLSQLNYQHVDAQAVAAIQQNRCGLKNLSSERVQGELIKILSCVNPDRSVDLMVETGVMKAIIGTEALPMRWKPMRSHEKSMDISITASSWRRRLVALINVNHVVGIEVAKYLKLSRLDQAYIMTLIRLCAHQSLYAFEGVYRYGLAMYQDYLLLSCMPMDDEAWSQALALNNDNLVFPLAGRDLTKLNVLPGPKMGELIKTIETWWISQNGKPLCEDCLNYAEKLIKNRCN